MEEQIQLGLAHYIQVIKSRPVALRRVFSGFFNFIPCKEFIL